MQIGKTGVYVYYPPPTGDVCSNTVVIDGREKVIIDPGLRHLWPYLEKAIEAETRIAPADFYMALHTHSHPDHMDAGALLEDSYGVIQAMSAEEKSFLEGEGRSIFQWMGLDYPSGTVGRLLKEGPLELGDKILQIYLTPGHTPGSVCIHWPEEGILITGDLIFARSFGRVDLAGGDAKALIASIERMASLDHVETVIPGHGPSIVGRSQVEKNFRAIFELFRSSFF
ncbi:MAG: MBL fold metallo-hydrolase [Deltaproteobacteria bacterium]|jgi:glyoxylase-like metal-dependent hydrolase (beta-lactamase superfamily II)|nr:MBL fold metallo-hydrolase [Deltaproteobacteria bacterium]